MTRSSDLFSKSIKLIPGGVNSPVRAFRSVGGNPLFISRAHGSKIEDVDGNTYIDYVGSWGPMIVGHANGEVISAVIEAAGRGTSYGAPTEMELTLAGKVIAAVPSMEMVRMVNSGTEATMSAIRLARGATGRDRIIKFNGCYHGHADGLLVRAGSGALTLGVPDSPGVPEDYAKNTLIAEYNDLGSVEALFEQNPEQIAAVIVEPVPGNMGVMVPGKGFLEGLREITSREGALLIFDEVMTRVQGRPLGASRSFTASIRTSPLWARSLGEAFPLEPMAAKPGSCRKWHRKGPFTRPAPFPGTLLPWQQE